METSLNLIYAIHVGVFIRQALEGYNMKQTELAEKTGVSKTIINEIMKGKRNINADFAILLEPIFGMPAKFWLGIQNDFDIAIQKAGNTIICEDKEIEIGSNSALDIAYWFVNRAIKDAKENSDYMTQLKIQKLLYFAQAISLKDNNKTLFFDSIMCWTYGPVVESVRKEFISYNKNPIKEGKKVCFDKLTEKVLEETYKKYGIYTANHLVELSHHEKAWKDANQNEIISPLVIKNTYTGIVF